MRASSSPGRNFSRARKVKEIRAALEGTVGAYAEWDTAAVRRHMENTPRVRVEAVVLGPKEKDNNAMPTYGQPMVQPPGFSAYRDCYVVIPLPPRAATEAAGPTDDAEAALEANRRVTGVIDSLLRHSFLPYQLQLAQYDTPTRVFVSSPSRTRTHTHTHARTHACTHTHTWHTRHTHTAHARARTSNTLLLTLCGGMRDAGVTSRSPIPHPSLWPSLSRTPKQTRCPKK